MTERSKAVFLSYASEDVEAANRVADFLREGGVEVWFDVNELRGGEAWDLAIRRQVHDCALFIPLISRNTEKRLEGYFRREWRLAADRTRDMADGKPFLLPVVIDNVREPSASVPEVFRGVQWIKLTDGKPVPAFLQQVLHLLGSAQPTPSPAAVTPFSTPRKRPLSRLIYASLGIAAVLLVSGYLIRDLVWPSRLGGHAPTNALSKNPMTANRDQAIAVLPFADMSEKHDQEYLADGMAEEILDVLAKIPGLHVIGRTSAFQFKGANGDLRKIGEALGAAHLLEGSVRRSGNHVRVTAQLIRASEGVHEWSQTYDRDVEDVLKLQNEIAISLSRALEISVHESLLSTPLVSPEAYDLFLRGIHSYERVDKEGLDEAAAFFQHAVDLDPTMTRATEYLALTHFVQADNAYVPAQFGFERARKEAKQLLQKDERSLFGHALLARVSTDYDWDWEAAKREATLAVQIAPHETISRYAAGAVANSLGQWDEAENQLREGLYSDPLDPDYHQLLGSVFYGAARFEDAAAEHRRAIEISPSFAFVHVELAMDLVALGQFEAAMNEVQRESPDTGKAWGLAIVHHALGNKAASDAALSQLLQSADSKAYEIATAYAFRGEHDKAFDWLDRAYKQKDFELTFFKGDWLLHNLRSDPRYKSFLRRMNLPG